MNHMNEPSFFRVSVKGIVIDDQGRILLAREEDGWWDMIGGGIDHDEDPIDALKREVTEETGLSVTYVSPTPKYFVTAKRRNHESYVANVIYEIQLANLDFTPSDECQVLRFFSPEEMLTLNIFPTVRVLAEQLLTKN